MPSNNMNPVLHIRNLNKTFGTTAALRDINLELRQGEMLFLLGPSGCGKTTLAKAVMHLIDAEGRLKINKKIFLVSHQSVFVKTAPDC